MFEISNILVCDVLNHFDKKHTKKPKHGAWWGTWGSRLPGRPPPNKTITDSSNWYETKEKPRHRLVFKIITNQAAKYRLNAF